MRPLRSRAASAPGSGFSRTTTDGDVRVRHASGDRVGKLQGRCRAAHIARPDSAFAQHRRERRHHALGGRPFVDVAEHHDRREQQRGRVRETFARNVGGAAMNRLEHRDVRPQIRRADNAALNRPVFAGFSSPL